jgi:hypothetical protein
MNPDCHKRFNTYECYEPADTEAVFTAQEALAHIEKAETCLKSITQ